MAEAVVSVVIEQTMSVVLDYLKEEASLLKDVKPKLDNMKKKMKSLQVLLEDAQNQSMKKTNNSGVKIWLEDLKDISYDMDDVLDEWNTRALILKAEEAEENTSHEIVGSSSCLSLKPLNCFNSVKQLPWRRDIAKRIKDINGRLNSVYSEMQKFDLVEKVVVNDGLSRTIGHNDITRTTTSFVDESKVYGRDKDKDFLLRKVLSVNGEQEESLQVVTIVGAGGLGKTTLAQLVYNDAKVKEKFEKRLWVCVSNPFDEVKVAQDILEGLRKDHSNNKSLEALHQSIAVSLSDKKFLLVLDDVWEEEDFGKWERVSLCLKVGNPNSRVLVTTRKEEVVRIMGTTSSNILKPGLISHSDCWLLMKQRALQGTINRDNDELEEIGKKIAKKCKGLPLAAKTLGGLLMSKDSIQEWRDVLHSEIWKLKKVEMDLFPHIFLSYQELPSVLKSCFLILALFPKDTKLDVENEVIPLWMAHGYLNPRIEQGDMVKIGYKYFKFLVSRAFLECRYQTSMVMHDIMHDFALYLAGDELVSIMVDEKTGYGNSSKSTAKRAPESTKVRHLIIKGNLNPTSIGFDLGELRTFIISRVPPKVTSNLVKQLKTVRMLKLVNCGLEQVPESIVNLIHLRVLILSDNPLVKLPETIGDLYNLQVLWFEGIHRLSTIPQSLGKLINLISLRPSNLAIEKVPESVGKLINLQSLGPVQIKDGKTALEFLKDLNQLQGLKLVFKSDYGDEVDAKKAAIGRKKHMTSLVLFCDHNVTDGVVAALEPPPNLQSLEVRGSMLPIWITSLEHLKVIRLYNGTASTLPPLWKLESLEEIHIQAFKSLNILGRGFLGIDNNPNKFCVYPKLVQLSFCDCHNLTGFEDLKPEEEGQITVMPNLQILEFRMCISFVEIPIWLLRQASSLKELVIRMSGGALQFDVKVNDEEVAGKVIVCGKNEYLIMSVKSSRKVPISVIIHSYFTLLCLFIQKERIKNLPPMGKLPYLESLTIERLSSLKFIGRDFLGIDNQEFVAFPNLRTLKIDNCEVLEGWEDLKAEDEGEVTVMPKLEELKIIDCPRFKELPPRLFKNLPSSLKVSYLPYADQPPWLR